MSGDEVGRDIIKSLETATKFIERKLKEDVCSNASVCFLSAGGAGVHIMAVCLLRSHPPTGGSAENSHRSWQTSDCKFSVGHILSLYVCIVVIFQIFMYGYLECNCSVVHCSPIPDLYMQWSHSGFSYMIFNKHHAISSFSVHSSYLSLLLYRHTHS